MPKKDGGPAFPVVGQYPDYNEPGMTMRDWFAGQALIGFLSHGPDKQFRENIMRIPEDDRLTIFYQTAAHNSYQQADAMIAERTKEKP